MLTPFEVPPGVFKNGTRYQSQGRFYDADLWRWFEGTQRGVGGWRKKSSSAVTGKARAIQAWVDNSNKTWVQVGTNTGLFVFSRSGTMSDITPAGYSPGPANASTGGGYGRGNYGRGTYGSPRPDDTNIIPAQVWTLDTWGEIAIACDGRVIYEWELDPAQPATVLTAGAPPDEAAPPAVAVFTTEEGAIVALGAADDPRKVEWSDPENRNTWKPAADNLAGGFRVQSSGRLQCGKRIRGGAILHTDVDAHLMTYSAGSPDIYEITRLASGCGIISQQAAAVVDSRDFWMGGNRFWEFNGTVNPLECEVGDFVFSNINRGQISKVSAVHNSQFGEVWWFYPSASSIEIDSYVVYNYREGHWSVGKLVRLCGTDKGVIPYPMMVDNDGFLYEHEVGTQRDGRRPYALSGPVEIGSGESTISVYGIIPDEANVGDVDVSFTTGDWTMSPDFEEGPFSLTEKTDVRFNGRRVSIKMIAQPDIDFRVGIFRFMFKQGPRR